MPGVHQLLGCLGTKLGQHYDLHEQAPLWDSGWNGPWNCSSFLAWGLWQTGDYQSLGCRPYSPSGHHATFPGWWKHGRIWAWTEWFYEDLEDYEFQCAEPGNLDLKSNIQVSRKHPPVGIEPIGTDAPMAVTLQKATASPRRAPTSRHRTHW